MSSVYQNVHEMQFILGENRINPYERTTQHLKTLYVYDLINDCSVIISAHIRKKGIKRLKNRGMELFFSKGSFDEVLEKRMSLHKSISNEVKKELKLKIRIEKKIVRELKVWFFNYVQRFKQGNENVLQNINIKEEHAKRVCREILTLADKLELNDDEKRLADIIALFHDIGRFEQYARYNTFMDSHSKNHAELGIKLLIKCGALDQFEETTKSLIIRTILYHNRAALPENESETCLLYTKLLRDADKLDIWRVVTSYYHRKNGKHNSAIELDLPNTPGFSDAVYQDLINRKIVNVKHIKNLNDFKLLQIGWVFDINFEPTLRAISSRRYLEKIREVLPKSSKIDDIFSVINSYYNERLAN